MTDNIRQLALTQKQHMPLEMKIRLSESKIREALNRHDCYISFSGGKDSMVLMHLVKSISNTTPVVYCSTHVEWPSVHKIAMKYADVVLSPSMEFKDIVKKYGYPAISKDVSQKLYEIRTTNSYTVLVNRLNGDSKGNGKLPACYRYLISSPYKLSHMCCDILKKRPAKKYERATGRIPFIGTMAADSRNRKTAYLAHACNNFADTKRPTSTPLGFWLRKDIDEYIKIHHLEVASIYEHVQHTGCVFCLFACTMQDFDKTEVMRKVRPGMYKQAVKLGMVEINKYIGVEGHPTLF